MEKKSININDNYLGPYRTIMLPCLFPCGAPPGVNMLHCKGQKLGLPGRSFVAEPSSLYEQRKMPVFFSALPSGIHSHPSACFYRDYVNSQQKRTLPYIDIYVFSRNKVISNVLW